MPDATQGSKQEPKLVQVMYDPRYGMQAFFDDGSIAKLEYDAKSGKDRWVWAENIVTEATYWTHGPEAVVR